MCCQRSVYHKKYEILLMVIMMHTISSAATSDSGQNPNQNPENTSMGHGGVTITVSGKGNDFVITATEDATGDKVIIPGTGSGTFTKAFSAFGYTGIISINENNLLGVEITGQPEIEEKKCENSTFCVKSDRNVTQNT